MATFTFPRTSLDELVYLLLKSGKQNFKHRTKFLRNEDIVSEKKVYPHSYMTSETILKETEHTAELNANKCYKNLKDEDLDTTDYERTHTIWNHFRIENIKQIVCCLTCGYSETSSKSFITPYIPDTDMDYLHFLTLPLLDGSVVFTHQTQWQRRLLASFDMTHACLMNATYKTMVYKIKPRSFCVCQQTWGLRGWCGAKLLILPVFA